MKSIGLFVVPLLALMVFAGCGKEEGKDDGTEDKPAPSAPAEKSPDLGFKTAIVGVEGMT